MMKSSTSASQVSSRWTYLILMTFSIMLSGCDSDWRVIFRTANEQAKSTLKGWLGEQEIKRNELALKIEDMEDRLLRLEKAEAQATVRVGLIDKEIDKMEERFQEEVDFFLKLEAKASGDDDVEIAGKTYSIDDLKRLAKTKDGKLKSLRLKIENAEARREVISKMLVAYPKIRDETENTISELKLTLQDVDQKMDLLAEKEEAVELSSGTEEFDTETQKIMEEVQTEVGGANLIADKRLNDITDSVDLDELESALRADL